MQVNETQRPVYVTQNGEAKAVQLDPQSYEKMKKALGLLKLAAQGERDLREDKIVAQAQLFKAMDEKVEKLKRWLIKLIPYTGQNLRKVGKCTQV